VCTGGCFFSVLVGAGLACFFGVADGDADLVVSEGDGDGDGAGGRMSSVGDFVTSGRASFEPRPSSSADTIPVAEPTATTTEAAATMPLRRAARRRSARRSARRRAREPDTR
jgi:hypothetical protein